ncbi:MAG: sel1 repeat family protein [Parachlamydiaceae bacterium]|nr:MAG: sel1 repeat family protein [Parachlamydiaceae bacterium]
MTIGVLEEMSEKGDVQAQSRLGLCYYRGEGVNQDYEKAVQYFKQAADQNDARAQSNLGICLMYGQGIEQNKEEAIKFLN